MSRSQGSGGFQADRPRLIAELWDYLQAWEELLQRGQVSSARWGALPLRSEGLQARARAVGFGGIALHLGELSRLVDAGEHNVAALRDRLQVVTELVGQARLALTDAERRELDAARAAIPPPPISLPAAGAALRPPKLLTMMRRPDPGALEPALEPPRIEPPQGFGDASPPLGGMPLAPSSPPMAPSVPAAPVPAILPPNAPSSNFSVRSMLGLRGFGAGTPPTPPPTPAGQPGASAPGGASLLGLRRISQPVRQVSQPMLQHPGSAPAPPPLVSGDPAALPPMFHSDARPEQRPSRVEASGAHRLLQRSRPERDSSPPRPRASRRRLHEREQATGGWWVGLVAALGVALGLGAIAGIVLWARGRSVAPATVSVDAGVASPSDVPNALAAARAPAELPRERLTEDKERLQSLLSQVHGRGGKESPELRALVEEEAALAARALNPKNCQGTGAACSAWAEVRDVLVGPAGKQVVKRRPSSGVNRVRSAWLAGLKMPDIPIEDDPRVRQRFEFYTENMVGRETLQSMLFRCGAYRDLIQSTLVRRGLPMDLLAVVFAESGCIPQAKSPAGAEGLWQFMPAAARAYHLRIQEGVVDERHSPPKSTEAAITYLSDLFQKLGSWDLVFAAYNMGPFGLMARIERAGGDVGYWDLIDADLLPEETSNYAPTIQAIALILANLQRLKFASIQMRSPQVTAELEVPPGTRLGLIARAAATSATQIRTLNLDVIGDRAPNLPGFTVQVPKDVVWQARDMLKELLERSDDADLCVSPAFDWGRQRFTEEMATACRRKLSVREAAPTTGAAGPEAQPEAAPPP